MPLQDRHIPEQVARLRAELDDDQIAAALVTARIELAEAKAERDRYFSTLAGALHAGHFDKVTCAALREPGEKLLAELHRLREAIGEAGEMASKLFHTLHGSKMDGPRNDTERALLDLSEFCTTAFNGEDPATDDGPTDHQLEDLADPRNRALTPEENFAVKLEAKG